MKVLPSPRETRTLLCFGLADLTAVEAMCLALGTPFEVSGTVHLQAGLAEQALRPGRCAKARAAVTAISVENFPASARYRIGRLKEMLAAYSPCARARHCAQPHLLGRDQGLRMFAGYRAAAMAHLHDAVHRARSWSRAIARNIDIRVVYDWSGGLIWLETPPTSDAGAVEIRRAIAEFGGHATLIRAEAGRGPASTCSSRSTRRSWRSRRHRRQHSIRSAFSIPAACIPGYRRAHADQFQFTCSSQDPTIASADAMLRRCVHCGFCTATCPTYVLTRRRAR